MQYGGVLVVVGSVLVVGRVLMMTPFIDILIFPRQNQKNVEISRKRDIVFGSGILSAYTTIGSATYQYCLFCIAWRAEMRRLTRGQFDTLAWRSFYAVNLVSQGTDLQDCA